MFESFTERARRVVVIAQDECQALGHEEMGSEHMLLGLLADPGGLAGQVLHSLGLDLASARSTVIAQRGQLTAGSTGIVPFTTWAKSAIELAHRESDRLAHPYVGTEHLLLGLIRMGKGRWLDVVHALGGDERDLRASMLGLIDSHDQGDEDLPPEDLAPTQ
jgi:ATP-dependent Clp protease ATP-binding subunit ClpC